MVDARWKLIHKKGSKPDVKADYPDVAYLTAIDTTKSLSKRDKNSKQIKNLQQMLVFLGYDLDEKSGYFNEQTKQAIEKYQTDNGLTVNGTADKATVESIETKVAQKVTESDNAYQKAVEKLSE